jgi:hypothetical protein
MKKILYAAAFTANTTAAAAATLLLPLLLSPQASADAHDALVVLRRRAATPAHAAFLDVVLQRVDAVAMRRVARTMTGVIDVAATAEDKVTRHNVQVLTLAYARLFCSIAWRRSVCEEHAACSA